MFTKLRLWLLCIQAFPLVRAFTFKIDTQPSQCDPLSVSWHGGQPPFRLIAVTPNFPNLNYSITEDNSQPYSGRGTFNVSAFPVPQGTQLFFAMSDATGPISGGTSNLMTVGASVSGQSCNSTFPANDFTFTIDRTLTQCADFSFSNYSDAVLPVTIFAFIPGGLESLILPLPPDTTVLHWTVKIEAQTQVAFSMIDSQGRKSGTDAIWAVAPSNDSSCLPPESSGASYDPGTRTTSPSAPISPSASTPNSDLFTAQKPTLSTGGIVGIAFGGASFLGIILAGLFWRRTDKKRYSREFTPNSHFISQYSLNSYANPTTSSSSGGLGRGGKFPLHRDMDEVMVLSGTPPSYTDRRPGTAESYRPAVALKSPQNRSPRLS